MPGANYLASQIYPATCSDGSRAMISMSELAITEDGRIPLAAAYGDNLLNAAFLELAAGFLQAFLPPADEAEWAQTWKSAPGPDAIASAFAAAGPMFSAYGPCPAFQDARLGDAELRPVAKLFHAVPSEGRLAMSVGAAMMALYAMQAHAHGGGRGYRTSMCGGGPLRTVPVVRGSLFQRAWALVLPRAAFQRLGVPSEDRRLIYPWSGEPKASDVVGRGSHPATTLYWAQPRRFLLPEPTTHGACPITGEEDVPLIEGVRERDGGPSYPSEQWRHPLTPYRVDPSKGLVSPVRALGFPDGIGWRNRAALLASSGDGSEAAGIVQAWAGSRGRAKRLGIKVISLHAYGVRCDNAKVVGYVDSVHPYRLAREEFEAEIEAEMRNAAVAADEVRRGLRTQLAVALHRGDPAEATKAMADAVDEAASAFWSRTEQAADALFDAVPDALAAGDAQDDRLTKARETFILDLWRVAVGVFDEMTASTRDADPVHVAGRRDALNGIPYWSSVRGALGLAVPEAKAKSGKAKTGAVAKPNAGAKGRAVAKGKRK